jgi:hypothetical protein
LKLRGDINGFSFATMTPGESLDFLLHWSPDDRPHWDQRWFTWEEYLAHYLAVREEYLVAHAARRAGEQYWEPFAEEVLRAHGRSGPTRRVCGECGEEYWHLLHYGTATYCMVCEGRRHARESNARARREGRL